MNSLAEQVQNQKEERYAALRAELLPRYLMEERRQCIRLELLLVWLHVGAAVGLLVWGLRTDHASLDFAAIAAFVYFGWAFNRRCHMFKGIGIWSRRLDADEMAYLDAHPEAREQLHAAQPTF